MKYLKFFLIIFIVIISLQLNAQEKTEKWYLRENSKTLEQAYVDIYGNIKIPFGKYDICFDEIFDDQAFVSKNGKILLIDKNQNILINDVYPCEGPDHFSEGLIRYQNGSMVGFADQTGRKVIPAQFDGASSFRNGYAAFFIGGVDEKQGDYTVRKGAKWGFVNAKGDIIIPAIYDRAHYFSNGFFLVEENGIKFYIDVKGNKVNIF